MSRSQRVTLSVLAALALSLPAVALLGKESASNRLTVISTTDVIGELSPCG